MAMNNVIFHNTNLDPFLLIFTFVSNPLRVGNTVLRMFSTRCFLSARVPQIERSNGRNEYMRNENNITHVYMHICSACVK